MFGFKGAECSGFPVDEISRNDLIPEQIIVEFTERGVVIFADGRFTGMQCAN